jgi:predicted TIM-barrel fold metal-dependent hydrolase
MSDIQDDLPGAADGAYLGSRRRFLVQAGCCLGAAVATLYVPPADAAPWGTDCADALAPAATELLARVLDGLDAAQLWDMHCHLLGNGDSGSGCTLHPSLTSGFNLIERIRKRVILDAAWVRADAPSIDHAYVERLARLASQFPAGARWLLFAFERAHDDAGRPDPAHTTIHVPDRYAAAVAGAQPERFGWVASVHPYRDDALEALAAAAQSGAMAVKWLPSSMNIDLRDTRSARFGERATSLGLPLIVHCGEEKAVPGARRDDLVNPLHVRAPLERGVRVIVAHCASLGHASDLDRPSAPAVPAFDLFARLMEERAHGDRLLGDISAVFQVNRRPEVWHTLLARQHWHPRLLHGSDYPLPGLKPLVSLGKLQDAGVLAGADVPALAALREANPLLFDLALKRRLRRGSAVLGEAVFATRRHFGDGAGGAAGSAIR